MAKQYPPPDNQGEGVLSYLDSNQDKLIQSQMCYRYTIGQLLNLISRNRVQKYTHFSFLQNFF